MGKVSQVIQEALFAQSMAITFFAGDLLVGGEFSRERHREYIQYFNTLLKYLQEINTPSPFGQLMNEIFPSLREESKNTDDFIDECRNMIELINDRLDLLREKEYLIFKKHNQQ